MEAPISPGRRTLLKAGALGGRAARRPRGCAHRKGAGRRNALYRTLSPCTKGRSAHMPWERIIEKTLEEQISLGSCSSWMQLSFLQPL
jgi:hypothetical protein